MEEAPAALFFWHLQVRVSQEGEERQHHCWGAGPCQGCQAPLAWAGGAIKPWGTAQGQQGQDLAWGRTVLLHLPSAPWLATGNS